MRHWGNSLRLGCPEFYGTIEDCLKEAEMIVFWSSDPDTTYGFEGTQRRGWAILNDPGPGCLPNSFSEEPKDKDSFSEENGWLPEIYPRN